MASTGNPPERDMKLPLTCPNTKLGKHYLGWHPDRCRVCKRARRRR